ncbi:MAG: metG [Chlamydiales bacterium]|jgi:methionyl-tRNA synthetase|nr:metG [Chlamydiales bacterium]
MRKKILITSALPYANGAIHFGHLAGAYLPADCYARYQRIKKMDVLYICGSDEYGVAIALSAKLANRSPQEHVDIFHNINKDLFAKLNFSFDHYSRTTWAGHVETTYQFFNDLRENGYINEQVTDQLYSEQDQTFLADRYVVGGCPRCGFDPARGDECPKCAASYEATDLKNPRSKMTNAPLVRRPTKHCFFLLDKFKDRLAEWISKKNWKPNVVNFIKHYIEETHPRAISRDSEWGIPVPLPDSGGKVLYVWFDAPIGYISATREWAQNQNQPDKWKDYWCDPETKLVQFIGKDNIPFHSVIFPAMVMGQNQPYKLVDELPANEFYMLEGKQFSKSEGWYIDLAEFLTKYSADQIRYTIAANAPESADSEFTWKDFQMRCNTELLGKFGNFVNRVLVFARANCQAKVPLIDHLEVVDSHFLSQINHLATQIEDCFESFQLRRACQLIMELAHVGNVYFNNKKPWEVVKQPMGAPAVATTIACCIECLKCLALVSSPIMPQTAQEIWKMIGFDSQLVDQDWDEVLNHKVPVGQGLPEPKVLFAKIEDAQIAAEMTQLQTLAEKAKQKSEPQALTPLKPLISIDHFDQLDLRVGQITKAEKVPKSKKLLKLEVDIGLEKRTILSGISTHVEAESLIGKKVVVVANLQPAKLMGIESQGMVLAAGLGSQLEVLHIEHLPPGSVVS